MSTPRKDMHMLMNLVGDSPDAKGATQDSIPKIDCGLLGPTGTTQQINSFNANHRQNNQSPSGNKLVGSSQRLLETVRRSHFQLPSSAALDVTAVPYIKVQN